MQVKNPAFSKRKQKAKQSQQEYDDFIQGLNNQAQIAMHESDHQRYSEHMSQPGKPHIMKKQPKLNNIIHDLATGNSSGGHTDSIYEQLKQMKESNARPSTNRSSHSTQKMNTITS